MYMKQIIFDSERDYINTHFLKRISYLMMYFGYTRGEVAKKANIARSTFYRYLGEGTAPTENALYKLASAFNSDWDIFAKNEFLIQEFNPETQTFNIKHCKWTDNDDRFYILSETNDSSQNFLIDDKTSNNYVDNTYKDINSSYDYSKDYGLIKKIPDDLSIESSRSKNHTKNTSNSSSKSNNQKVNKICSSRSSAYIFYSDNQFYDLLDKLGKTFEKYPSNKNEIYYKLLEFTNDLKKDLRKKNSDLEKEQKIQLEKIRR